MLYLLANVEIEDALQRYIIDKVFERTVSDIITIGKISVIGKKNEKDARFYRLEKEDVRLVAL